mmetsp:Transcript_34877/g.84385  ORF Transcript_34877/g.84385 Transcript_34877/m.84385 type:complete len:256 (+) Transcript_34877:1378-2145(+)
MLHAALASSSGPSPWWGVRRHSSLSVHSTFHAAVHACNAVGHALKGSLSTLFLHHSPRTRVDVGIVHTLRAHAFRHPVVGGTGCTELYVLDLLLDLLDLLLYLHHAHVDSLLLVLDGVLLVRLLIERIAELLMLLVLEVVHLVVVVVNAVRLRLHLTILQLLTLTLHIWHSLEVVHITTSIVELLLLLVERGLLTLSGHRRHLIHGHLVTVGISAPAPASAASSLHVPIHIHAVHGLFLIHALVHLLLGGLVEVV